MKISIIIISYNTSVILRKCLEGLFQNPPSHEWEIFVVDNNSSDDSAAMVKSYFTQVKLIENSVNKGFAAANNKAYKKSSGDYIILLNPDAFVKAHAIDNSLSFMESHPNVIRGFAAKTLL